MKTVENPFGPFDYIVTGKNEDAAAAELSAKLDHILHLPSAWGWNAADDLHAAVRLTAEKYGVEIKTTLD